MAKYEETVEGWKDVTVAGLEKKPVETSIVPFQTQQRPMLLRMPFTQQIPSQSSFPIIFFLFPRIAMLLGMMQGGNGSKGLGIQKITQIVRDKDGFIKEIVEFVG